MDDDDALLRALTQYKYVVSIDPGIRYFAYVVIDVSGRCVYKWRMQPLLTEIRDKNKAPDENEQRLMSQRLMLMASGLVPINDYTKVLVLVEPWLYHQPSMKALYNNLLKRILQQKLRGHTYKETADIIDTYLQDVQQTETRRKGPNGWSKTHRKRFVFEHVLPRLPRRVRTNYTLAEHKDDLADAMLQFLAHFHLEPSWFRLPTEQSAHRPDVAVIDLADDDNNNVQRLRKKTKMQED